MDGHGGNGGRGGEGAAPSASVPTRDWLGRAVYEIADASEDRFFSLRTVWPPQISTGGRFLLQLDLPCGLVSLTFDADHVPGVNVIYDRYAPGGSWEIPCIEDFQNHRAVRIDLMTDEDDLSETLEYRGGRAPAEKARIEKIRNVIETSIPRFATRERMLGI